MQSLVPYQAPFSWYNPPADIRLSDSSYFLMTLGSRLYLQPLSFRQVALSLNKYTGLPLTFRQPPHPSNFLCLFPTITGASTCWTVSPGPLFSPDGRRLIPDVFDLELSPMYAHCPCLVLSPSKSKSSSVLLFQRYLPFFSPC